MADNSQKPRYSITPFFLSGSLIDMHYKTLESLALTQGLSEHYPERYNGKVPKKVRMVDTVHSDLPILSFEIGEEPLIAIIGMEYYVTVNCHGAVTALLSDMEKLGLKPSEFEVIEFH